MLKNSFAFEIVLTYPFAYFEVLSLLVIKMNTIRFTSVSEMPGKDDLSKCLTRKIWVKSGQELKEGALGLVGMHIMHKVADYVSNKYKFNNNIKLYVVSFAVVYWIHLFIRNTYRDIVLDSLKHCQLHKGLDVYAGVFIMYPFLCKISV